LTENVAFLIDFDSNLMVFDRHFLARAAVDNLLRKGNVGTTVIRPLSLVICSGNKQAGGTGKSIADCGVRIAD